MTEGTWAAIIIEGVAILGSGMVAYVSIRERITRVETRLEDFITSLGIGAARGLHSPDDHLGLDDILDHYVSHHYELPANEWKELYDRCREISEGVSTPGEKALSALLMAVCEHKMGSEYIKRANK